MPFDAFDHEREQVTQESDTDGGGGDTPADSDTINVMTYNILAGGGSRLQHVADVIRDVGADIVGLQEVLQPDWVCRMAESLGMHHVIGRSPDRWHVALLSRYPIAEVRTHTGPEIKRCLLDACVAIPNRRALRVFVTHLHAGYQHFRAGEGRRLREVSFVLDHMREARLSDEPHLVMGDLNSLSPGERLEASRVLRHALSVEQRERADGRRLRGHPNLDNILPAPLRPLRPLLVGAFNVPTIAWLGDQLVNAYVPRAVVRRLLGAGYTDLYAAAHPDLRTRGYTCPLPDPGGRIDYIFADPRAAAGLVSSDIIIDAPGRRVTGASDHRPVIATLRLGACSASWPSTP
jgi:endonuclease/exonuclease/phosphatase family metal-dependent hydrolase